MAKRKRLSPANPGAFLGADSGETVSKPPIADVAGQAASEAALSELSTELEAARAEGRMVVRIPLSLITSSHLVRDRTHIDEAEMQALMASIRKRGQQTPIEVVELGDPKGGYGLISGARRIEAVQRLGEENPGQFDMSMKALIRRPETAADAYVAMVEENEIRAGLSFYERARIVSKAAEQGVYPDRRAALRGLFGNISAPKRSKINSFLTVYDGLDDMLRFAELIPEHLGLALAKKIAEDGKDAVRQGLQPLMAPAITADEERAALEAVIRSPKSETNSAETEVINGVTLKRGRGRVVLSGPAVDDAFVDALRGWLAQ